MYKFTRDTLVNGIVLHYYVWIIFSFYASAVAFYVPALTYASDIVSIDGKTDGFWAIGAATYTILIFSHNFTVMLETRHFTIVTIGYQIFSWLLYFPFMITLDNYLSNVNGRSFYMEYACQS